MDEEKKEVEEKVEESAPEVLEVSVSESVGAGGGMA